MTRRTSDSPALSLSQLGQPPRLVESSVVGKPSYSGLPSFSRGEPVNADQIGWEQPEEARVAEASKNRGKPRRKKVESPFAANLARALKERGVTIKAASALAGVAANVVTGWTSGSVPHDFAAVQRLARGLGIDFEVLLTGESSRLAAENLTLTDLFREERAFSGLFKIEAVRMVRRGRKSED